MLLEKAANKYHWQYWTWGSELMRGRKSWGHDGSISNSISAGPATISLLLLWNERLSQIARIITLRDICTVRNNIVSGGIYAAIETNEPPHSPQGQHDGPKEVSNPSSFAFDQCLYASEPRIV